ncbi:hypothetical protein GGR56DRAFT_335253 [Xylariaceae sp. FL0804]|nr:hypothetical protein GGR56DRAFT_335253 [Xylariaceae sp. FL0804]
MPTWPCYATGNALSQDQDAEILSSLVQAYSHCLGRLRCHIYSCGILSYHHHSPHVYGVHKAWHKGDGIEYLLLLLPPFGGIFYQPGKLQVMCVTAADSWSHGILPTLPSFRACNSRPSGWQLIDPLPSRNRQRQRLASGCLSSSYRLTMKLLGTSHSGTAYALLVNHRKLSTLPLRVTGTAKSKSTTASPCRIRIGPYRKRRECAAIYHTIGQPQPRYTCK